MVCSSDEADLSAEAHGTIRILDFLQRMSLLGCHLRFFFFFNVSIPTTSKLENFRACLVGFRVFSVGKALSLRIFAVAIVLM